MRSRSTFCQLSGFFLTLGIEACDIAVLLIAIHTALFIVKGGGSNGLYPYRAVAYTIYIVFPLFLASIAFINKPAYVNSGEYCYLPTHSGWSRQALSWIPRYVIFTTIIVIYACVYIYVSFAMAKYGSLTNRTVIASSDGHSDHRRRRSSVPKMPKLIYNGLLSPTPSSSRRSSNSRRDSLLASIVPEKPTAGKNAQKSKRLAMPRPEQTIKWKSPNFGLDSAYSTDPAANGSLTLDTTLLATQLRRTPEIAPIPDLPIPPGSCLGQDVADSGPAPSTSGSAPTGIRSFWNRSLALGSQRPSLVSLSNIISMLRRGSRNSSTDVPSVVLTPRTIHATGMQQTREDMKRQTRYLFVYPLVYVIVWLMPLVAHIIRSRGHKTPFAIDLLSLISLCIQGAVDALVFSLRERPWRVSEEDGASRPIAWWQGRRAKNCKAAQPGRTREEMLLDARLAKRRLDDEIAEKHMDLLSRRSATVNWWDVSGPARAVGMRRNSGEDSGHV